MMMIDLLRQRLQSRDRIRVNNKAHNKRIRGQEGEVVGYTNVNVRINGEVYNITPTSLDVLETHWVPLPDGTQVEIPYSQPSP